MCKILKYLHATSVLDIYSVIYNITYDEAFKRYCIDQVELVDIINPIIALQDKYASIFSRVINWFKSRKARNAE